MTSSRLNIVIGVALLAVVLVVAVFGFGLFSKTNPPAVTAPPVAEAPEKKEPAVTNIKKVEVKIPPLNPPRRYMCGKKEAVFVTDQNQGGMLSYDGRAYPLMLDQSASNASYKTVAGVKPAMTFSAQQGVATVQFEDGSRVECTLVAQPDAANTQDTASAPPAKKTDDAQESVADNTTAVAVSDGEIEGIVWQATELNGKPVAEGTVITMQLTDGRIAGKSACNRYTGPYTLDAPSRSLKVTGPVAGTRMACPPELMEIEAAFNDVLPTITAYRVEGGSVLTVFAGTDEVLRLAQQPAE